MKFSILICTVVSRKKQLANLLKILEPQLTKYVEVLTECDNKEISVGRKRQILLERAKGDYVAFIDDDDAVSSDYVAQILQAIKQQPDCIGLLIRCNMEGKLKHAKASNQYDDWMDNVDGYDYVRTTYHKTPIKRWIALKIGFKDLRFREDYDFAVRLKKSALLNDEVFINKELYHYQYKYENPILKYGL